MRSLLKSGDIFDEMILVVHPTYHQYLADLIPDAILKLFHIVSGGKERKDSVLNGLNACSDDSDYVLIHDSVRPLVSKQLIENILLYTIVDGACIPALPVRDTLKTVDKSGLVASTVDRSPLRAVQTPQGFDARKLKQAFEEFGEINLTDEAQYFEKMKWPVRVVDGEAANIKITYQQDLKLVENLYER